MPILNITSGQTGLVGVLPSIVYIETNDPVATVYSAGYLDKAIQNGLQLNYPCMAVISTKETSNSLPQVQWCQIVSNGSVASVVTPSGGVAPGAANELAIYGVSGNSLDSLANGTTGYVLTSTGLNSAPSWQPGGSLGGAVLLTPSANQTITGAYYLRSNNVVQGYTSTPTAAGTTTLTVGSTYQQYFTGTTTETVVLPDVSTLVIGFEFKIVNNSSGIVTVNSSGGNLVEAMDPLTQLVVTCVSITGTTAASWDTDYTADILPVPLADGGTNATLTATNNALVVGTASAMNFLSTGNNGVLISSPGGVPSWLANGTSGQLLTAGAGAPSWQNATPTAVRIDGDSSFVSGTTLNLISDVATNNSGSSVAFVGNGTTTMTLNLSDVNLNTIIGNGSGNSSITGLQNIGLGCLNLVSLTTGQGNVALGGLSTLNSLTTGSNNIAIGNSALSTSVSSSNNVAIGVSALVGLDGGLNNVGIGNGALGSNAGPSFSDLVAVGANALGFATTATNCVAVGARALSSSAADSNNTAIGYEALLELNGGVNNTAVGASALNLSITDNDNTAIGAEALRTCDGGISNTSVGSQSMLGLTTGSGNSALGTGVLFSLTTGIRNNAIGQNSLGSLTTGSENQAFGRQALDSLVSGSFCVAIGDSAGRGYGAAESSNITINANGQGGENNVLRIGEATGTGDQELNTVFIQGIFSNTQNPSGTVEYVTIDNTTGLLGVTTVGGGSSAWVDQTTTPVTMDTNTGYTSNAGATLIAFTLPTTSAVGDFIEINGKGAGLWQILQGAGQQIFGSPLSTTLGAGGSLSSVNQYDNVRLRCITADTEWTIVSQQSTGLTYV